jgi:opacity protein-like surface antigen
MKKEFLYVILILFLQTISTTALAQNTIDDHPFEIGGQLTVIDFAPLPSISTNSAGVFRFNRFDRSYGGIGGRFGYNLNNAISIEAEASDFKFNRFDNRKTQVLAGIKAGFRLENLGIFAKARPGVMYFSNLQESCSTTDSSFTCVPENRTNFAFDLGGVIEYYPSSRTIIRFDAGDTIIHLEQWDQLRPSAALFSLRPILIITFS